MSVKALQDYTYYSKYARYNKEEKRRETWAEAVDRVRDMHLKRYPQIADEINWAFDASKQKRALGSQRALQFGGTPIEKKHARIYNCTVSFCDRLRFFQESFWLLLCGCGVGFSVQKHHVDRLPNFSPAAGQGPKRKFVIPDTIEGWSDALGILIATYFPSKEFPGWEGFNVQFDYSGIRKAGSYLSSGVGKAPGHEPLKRALDTIRVLLDHCVEKGQIRLRPIDAYDLVMHASDAVLSGGVRRSATICIFSIDDEEMIKAKTGNWFVENPQRGRSNNSALLLKGKTTREQFVSLMESVKQYGEPGFYWSDSTEQLPNPCVAGDTAITTTNGIEMAQNLNGLPFNALVEGNGYHAGNKGFWETGFQKTIRIQFTSGRSIVVTPNHLVLTVDGWKEAGELTSSDEVVVNNHREFSPEVNSLSENFACGYCLGNFLSDGNVSHNAAQMKWWGEDKHEYRSSGVELLEQAGWETYNRKSKSDSNTVFACLDSSPLLDFAIKKGCFSETGKQLSRSGICGDWNYLAGLVAGYFDADGTVAVNPQKGSSVRICSSQIANLENIQIVLNAFGISSKIYYERYPAGLREMPDGKGGTKQYECAATHDLHISCDNIERFLKFFPIKNQDKLKAIKGIVSTRRRTPNRTVFTDRVVSISSDKMQIVYDASVSDVEAFDANGIYVHNCVEIGMWPVEVETGESGWQFCNLCEINGKKIKTKKDFALAARAAAIIGTLQAGYTDFAYLGPVTEKIVRREALLGVSITGMMDNPDVIFDPEIQKEMAQLVVTTNEEIAKKIGINAAARCTCVKPAGTTSCVLGSSSGIHPHHGNRYLRRVQANSLEPVFQHFKTVNPSACEPGVWSANKTDEVISFCCEVEKGARTKNDIDAIQLLEHVKLTQQNWVTYGKTPSRCVQPWLTHNVSNTINVRETEWETVAAYIYDNHEWFAGISLIPASGDLDYPQAPFVNVWTPREILQEYGEGVLFASGLIVDGLHAFNNNLWEACDVALGISKIEPLSPDVKMENATPDAFITILKTDWVRRVKQFAERYCEGNIRKCCYLLKHVSIWKQWVDLKREYKEVDYTSLYEETDETVPMETIACSGGKCELGVYRKGA
jgi:hypothetical protein